MPKIEREEPCQAVSGFQLASSDRSAAKCTGTENLRHNLTPATPSVPFDMTYETYYIKDYHFGSKARTRCQSYPSSRNWMRFPCHSDTNSRDRPLEAPRVPSSGAFHCHPVLFLFLGHDFEWRKKTKRSPFVLTGDLAPTSWSGQNVFPPRDQA